MFKHKKHWFLTSLYIFSLILPGISLAEGDDSNFRITVGAWNKLSQLYVYKNASRSETEAAILKVEETAPMIRLSSKNLASAGRKMLFTIEAGFSQFTTETQDYYGRDIDYGTSADVQYFFVMPVIAYHTGADRTSNPAEREGFNMSAGFGLMHLSAEGTYVDTRYGHYTGQKEGFVISETGTLVDLFVGYQIRGLQFGLRATVGGIEADDTQTQNSYMFTEGGLEATYSLFF